MLRTYMYVPDDLDEKVARLAKARGESKAKIMRAALDHGLKAMHSDTDASAEVLFKIAEIGRRYKVTGPKNSSQKIDELLWGKDWSKDE